jgi:hypothetical protein
MTKLKHKQEAVHSVCIICRLKKKNTNTKTSTGILTPDNFCGQIIQIVTGTKERHEERDDSIFIYLILVSTS